MTKRILLSLSLALLGALWLGGCGSGDGAGGTRVGPASFALPFVPTTAGVTAVIGIKNVSRDAAPVYLTAYDNAGGTYGAPDQRFTVPAQGELRVPLTSITGGATNGGWVHVEARDITTLDPVTGEPAGLPTTGFVFAYLHRTLLGGNNEVDAVPGLVGRTTGVAIPVTPNTGRVQLVNYSYDQTPGGLAPQAVIFNITTFDQAGVQVGAPVVQLVQSNGAFDWLPSVTMGTIRAEPVGAPFPPARQIRYALAGRENGFQLNVESRYTQAGIGHWPQLVDMGFEVAFGSDPAGNVHDFGLLLHNPTGSNESVTLQAVFRKGGAPVLTVPRGYALGAGRTVWMRTTTNDSVGLLQGESSWFQDIFGDVFATTSFDEVTLYLQASRGLNVSARHFDPAFNAFYQVLRPIPRTNRACVYDLPIQVSQSGGLRNYVSITNTSANPLTIPIRAYTPMLGTEYILDSIEVPAFTRLDWSPDGTTYREEPTNPLGASVSFLRLDFSPSTGALFRGWTEARDAGQMLLYLAPTLTRD